MRDDGFDDVRALLSIWRTDRRPLRVRALESRQFGRRRGRPAGRGPTSSALPKLKNQCRQCWKVQPPEKFITKRGTVSTWCEGCRDRKDKRAKGMKLPPLACSVSADVPLRAKLVPKSGNHKLGGIPSSVTSRGTCPPSCSFYTHGCYAEVHLLAYHWRVVGERGDSWRDFCSDVEDLPPGQLWRHNTAGDLPGQGEAVDEVALEQLIRANRGRRGFTFSHKHRTAEGLDAIRRANASGFVVNLSADTLKHADELVEAEAGPVAVVIPSDTPDRGLRTPAGRKVIVCPAQKVDGRDMNCARCELCAIPSRKAIVGFRAHGVKASEVDAIVTLRRGKGGPPLPLRPTLRRPRRAIVPPPAPAFTALPRPEVALLRCKEPVGRRGKPCGTVVLTGTMCTLHAARARAAAAGLSLVPAPCTPAEAPSFEGAVRRLLEQRGSRLVLAEPGRGGVLTLVAERSGVRIPLAVLPMPDGHHAMTLAGTVTDVWQVVRLLDRPRPVARPQATQGPPAGARPPGVGWSY